MKMQNSEALMFGANLRRFRTISQMTLAEVGELMEKDSRTISAWELGTREPSLASIKRLAIIYKVDANELFRGVL